MFSLGLETRNLQINALRAFDIHWEKLELLYLCTTNLSLNQIPGDLKWFFKHTVWRKFSYFKFFTLCFTFESIHLKKKKKKKDSSSCQNCSSSPRLDDECTAIFSTPKRCFYAAGQFWNVNLCYSLRGTLDQVSLNLSACVFPLSQLFSTSIFIEKPSTQ